jgi:hypothetical protein
MKITARSGTAPADTTLRARYVAALRGAYQRGELRPRLHGQPVEARILRDLFMDDVRDEAA